MLLVIEILLTVAAWRKGWKAWALLPWGITMFMMITIGLAVGLAVGASGGNAAQDAITGIGFLLDFALIITLAVMSLVAPKRQPVQLPQADKPAKEEAQEPVEVVQV